MWQVDFAECRPGRFTARWPMTGFAAVGGRSFFEVVGWFSPRFVMINRKARQEY
jgi:hypothetical protein